MTVNFKMGADNFYEKNMKFVEVSVENKERCSILDRPSGFVIKYPGQYVQDGLQDKRMSRQHPCLPKIIKRHINIFYLPFPNTMVFSIFPYGVIEQYFKQERIFHAPNPNAEAHSSRESSNGCPIRRRNGFGLWFGGIRGEYSSQYICCLRA